jgi:LacI family transcriptional regulator
MPAELTRSRSQRNVTLRDVAGRAEVSVATASRVLAGDYPVAEATRDRVMQAVHELDYATPPPRSAPRKRTRMVAIIAEDMTIPMVIQTAAGVEDAAAEAGRLCLIRTIHGDLDRELDTVELLRDQRNVDAVILIGGVVETDEYRQRMRRYAQELAAAGSRLVLCGRPPLGPDAPAVVVQYDNTGGAYAATSHLLSAGHRRIAMLAGVSNNTTNDQRNEGYRQALADYDLTADSALVRGTTYDRASGYTATKRLLDDGAEFTAIFAHNDLLASGALVALRERGLRVPQDVSLVGYDNSPVAQELVPALTTVNLPCEELGRTAVRLALANPQPGSGRDQVTLATHVVVRDSVRRIQPAG